MASNLNFADKEMVDGLLDELFDPPFYFCRLEGMAVSLFYREAFILMSEDTVR